MSARPQEMTQATAALSDAREQTVWAFSPAIGDFVALVAVRYDRDEYELLEGESVVGFAAGDRVRCELSDGELIVCERIYRDRLC